MIKRLIAFCIVLMFAVSPAIAVGPREPLTFNDAGLYTGWNEYVVSKECPFNFLVVQAICYPTGHPLDGNRKIAGRTWNEWLKIARANGKRVIADISAVEFDADGNEQSLGDVIIQENPLPVPAFINVFDQFLQTLDTEELYGITIGEEHVFWNGQLERLEEAYDLIKAKHDVPVFQWYSPSTNGSKVGIEYPNLKSDGWVADEYHADGPWLEKTMRAYVIKQKPITQMIWAHAGHSTIPFLPERFHGQIEVCRKYNIPTSYFGWGFNEDESDESKANFQKAAQSARDVKTVSAESPTSWDTVPWEMPVIELGFTAPDDKSPSYREDYHQRRGMRFINETNITGFQNLRWDGAGIDFRPRSAGEAKSVIRYQFSSAFPVTHLNIKSTVTVTAGQNANVTVNVLDSNGKRIGTATLKESGEVHIDVSGKKLSDTRFDIELEMAGTASAPSQVLAGIDFLEVNADVNVPDDRAVQLQPGADGSVVYRESLESLSILKRANLKNFDTFRYTPSGLHRFPGNQPMEVVQKFKSPATITPTRLSLEGSANFDTHAAKVGIGISLDGKNIIASKISSENVDESLTLDLSDVADKVRGKEFYVHLYLEGGYGLISAYTVEAHR